MEEIRLGNLYGAMGGNYAGNVYDMNGLCPTINTCGGGREPMIVETKELGFIEKGSGKHQSNIVYAEDGLAPTITASYGYKQPPAMHVEIKQATKDGYIPCKIGGVADLSYPTSQTRRGRVIENGEICPTLTTENIPSVLEPWIWEIDGVTYLIRIRKLTPREVWRLMDFRDEDFDKAQAVNSNTQLYKQAGNSIVRNVLVEALRPLFSEV